MATLSSTAKTLRQGFMDYIHESYRGTTTGAGAGTFLTFIDSALNIYSTDKFATWWALITAGTYINQFKRVASFTKATGTVTVESAYGGQILGSITYELLRYHPINEILVALNQALKSSFPSLRVSRINEDLITGNILPNSSFETWTVAGYPDQWATTTVSAAKEATLKLYGAYSMAITGAATAGYVACTQATWPALLDLSGQGMKFEAWVKTDTANHARLQIVDDDGTSSSSYHTGGNTWELLQVTRTIKTSTKTIAFRCCGDVNTKVAYYDFSRAIGPLVYSYVLPLDFSYALPTEIYVVQSNRSLSGFERACDDQGQTWPTVRVDNWKVEYDGRLGLWLLRLASPLTEGYKIRLVGGEHFTDLSVDTDTVSIGGPHALLLYAKAAERLFTTLGFGAKGDFLVECQQKVAMAQRDIAVLENKLAIEGEPRPVANYGRWQW